MSSVVVTVMDGKGGSRDLELPGDVPVSVLGLAIAQALHHPDLPSDETPVKAVLKPEGTDEVIPLDMSLEAAGVAHGDVLLLLVKAIPPSLVERDANLRFSGPGLIHTSGRTYAFRGNTILIGRVDRSSGIVSKVLGVDLTDLEDAEGPSVSRRHAQVLFRDGEYLLQDLKSTNGTIVNGCLLSPETRCPLNHGDEVQFGDVALFFLWDSQEDQLNRTEEQPTEMGGLE